MNLLSPLRQIFRINEIQEKALARMGICTVRDLLYHFPTRYTNISEIKKINELVEGETATIYGKFWSPDIKRGYKTKMLRAEGEVSDDTGKIKVLWFNQAYIAKMIHSGQNVEFTGKVTKGKNGLYLANPEFKKIESFPVDTHESLFNFDKEKTLDIFGFPVYNETRGISSKWIFHTIDKIIKQGFLKDIEECLPDEILKKYKLPSLATALVWIHMPKSENDANIARKRFAFEEIFFIQLARAKERNDYEENRSYVVNSERKNIEDFTNRFPFDMTLAQNKAIEAILKDISEEKPMARLLEGDVGSGKTAVAATSAYATIMNRPDGKTFGNLQVAYMAPTEILATQHFENFINYFKHTGISIGLITGSGCRKFPTKVASAQEPWTNISRAQLLKWVGNGEIPILIGTHALIQKSVKFKHLALVVVDEQHRFGALQRAKLAKKDQFAPHYLSMTATPIPRTLALTIYGDLDLTLLDEMPKGRKQILTEIISTEKRGEVYQKIRAELKNGRQLYVICPRIASPEPQSEVLENSGRSAQAGEPSKAIRQQANMRADRIFEDEDMLNMKNVTSEAKRLKKEVFPEYEIDILHSKMSKQKKEDVMADFYANKIQILVATSVVEVGVNVPNATIIIIEGAERFGLAQLHQLRGRVIRSNHQAYCYLFTSSSAKTSTDKNSKNKTFQRLSGLVKAKNGFELAELDLALRGAGELSGTKQWGITDLGMEAIKNIKMVEAARTEAREIVKNDPKLSQNQSLAQALTSRHLENLHFE